MEPWIVFSIITFLLILLSATFKYLVTKKKIKPNIVSKVFYYDDESFVKSWKKTKEKGLLMFIIKNAIYYTFYLVILFGITFLNVNGGKSYLYENRLLLIVIFVAFGCLLSPIKWNMQQDKYSKLTEKEQIENDSIN